MHFTITNPHLGLLGRSKFCSYIQICSYKHDPYMWAQCTEVNFILRKHS